MLIDFDNTYSKLNSSFFEPVDPTPVKAPQLIAYNQELSEQLGLPKDFSESDSGIAILSGNLVPEGAEPIAMAYSGHQFGGFNPRLGDGRAILLGEVISPDGIRNDIQLKGAGPTPFSRRGDGRSALGPVLREYLVSEAMASLGIPTTRALAAVSSGETVIREQSEPGGVFTRVARSHLRIGTIQYFSAHEDFESLKTLVDYAINRHFPEMKEAENPSLALLESVMNSQANLVAKWMGVGFIHGVMNTDNMSLSGETIDYGPCAFMDYYDPGQKYSYIDRGGRYAFANQPSIAHWNLTRLAEALLPIMADSNDTAIKLAESVLNQFPSVFESKYIEIFCRKIGISKNFESAWPIAESFLNLMAEQKADFTLSFRSLVNQLPSSEAKAPFKQLFSEGTATTSWLKAWRHHFETNKLDQSEAIRMIKLSNPVFIPRNHRIEEVIKSGKEGDFAPFHQLHKVLQNPFDEQPDFAQYETPPLPEQVVPATFCGT